MTTLTLHRMRDDFIVTGPDIEPAKFKSEGLVHGTLPGLAHQRDRRARATKQGHAAKGTFGQGMIALRGLFCSRAGFYSLRPPPT
jgi:hypothetical protein